MNPIPPPEGAQAALIAAGLRLFGDKGYDATSTRALAAAAGVNIAMIAYHFGGKEGLRRACGQEVVRRISLATGMPPSDISPARQPPDRAAALDHLERIVRAVTMFLCLSEEGEAVVGFMLHELMQGGGVLDDVYSQFIGPKHAEISALWAAASGQQADSDAVKLSAFSLIGQILYFRIGRQIVARKMGWAAIGPTEATQIADLIVTNLRNLLQKGPA